MKQDLSRDRIAHLTAPSPSHINFNVKLFANVDADANADAGGSTIALPGLPPGKLKRFITSGPVFCTEIPTSNQCRP